MFLAVVVPLSISLARRSNTYEQILRPFMTQHGCELVDIWIPKFYQTGPFPKIAFRRSRLEFHIFSCSLTHIEYRIVSFKTKTGDQCTRWVRLLINPKGAQEIVWEPGTTEVPDEKNE
jgi:hypothetical protein